MMGSVFRMAIVIFFGDGSFSSFIYFYIMNVLERISYCSVYGSIAQ